MMETPTAVKNADAYCTLRIKEDTMVLDGFIETFHGYLDIYGIPTENFLQTN
jgi:hypothetical protein